MPKPYDRLKGESEQAYSHFVAYRDMGLQRSQRKAAKKLGLSDTTLTKHATNWKWRDRVLAWDRMVDAKQRKVDLDAIMQMRKRHISMSQGLQNLTARELNKMIDVSKSETKLTLSPEQLAKLMSLGIDVERTSRGQPTDIVAEAETVDLSGFTLKELRELKKLRKKLGDDE